MTARKSGIGINARNAGAIRHTTVKGARGGFEPVGPREIKIYASPTPRVVRLPLVVSDPDYRAFFATTALPTYTSRDKTKKVTLPITRAELMMTIENGSYFFKTTYKNTQTGPYLAAWRRNRKAYATFRWKDAAGVELHLADVHMRVARLAYEITVTTGPVLLVGTTPIPAAVYRRTDHVEVTFPSFIWVD
ncbi:MAG: hypothetical protein ACKVZ0_04540 [Gemmatimonadales bacterium]